MKLGKTPLPAMIQSRSTVSVSVTLCRSLCLAASLLFAVASEAQAEVDVEFILDVSGSMKQKIGNDTQIDLARTALSNALGELNANQAVALRVYGHRVDQANKDESCKDSELLMPFQPVNKAEFAKRTGTLTPKGYTPIAYSLEQSRNDLLDVGVGREAERVIILLTDGEETCGGDPVKVLEKLKAEGFRLTVYTVGFNVNEVARKQLTDIAAVTGGKYFDAKNGAQLGSALKEATKASTLVQKTRATYGNPIRGGDSYEQAVKLEIGKEYHLDHLQKQNEFDYFMIDGKKSSYLTVALKTLTRGIAIDSNGQIGETNNPYAGLQIHGSERTEVRHIDIIGSPSKRDTAEYRVPADGPVYFLVGSTYNSMHQDQVLFQISEEQKGDAGTANDAGDTLDTALEIQAQRYPKSWLGEGDRIDTFRLKAKKGDKLVIGVVPNGTVQGYFTLRVYDEFRQNLFDRASSSNAGLRSEEIAIPEEGDYAIEVGYPNAADTVDYSLVIRPTPAAAVAPESATPAQTPASAPAGE